jgi:cytosine/adenosine deaminase-related metal-dependent hydrolase
MVTVGLAPTTTTYDNPGFMRDVARIAAETGTRLHVHCHPRPDERALCAARGTTPLDFLDDAGWLTDRTFFAHATRLTADEMRRCADAGVAVAHCPRMILRLGARVTPVHDMLAAGMRVGVGVDGGASNDSGSMLGEMRVALLLHRLAGGEGEVPWQQWLSPYRLLCMATRDAAAIIGRNDIGRLETGACADLAAFDLDSVAYAGARTDPLSALLLAGDDDRAALVMVGGQILVRDRRLLIADERAISARVDAATERLIAQAAAVTGIDYRAFT